MNLRWLWLDHVPQGVELTDGERCEVRTRSKLLRSRHPSTMHKHGSLIFSIMIWSILEAALLLLAVLYVIPWAQARGWTTWALLALPLVICLPFWLAIALAFNRSHSPFVRQALNEMGHEVCVRCGYALRGLGDCVRYCPECGAERGPMAKENVE